MFNSPFLHTQPLHLASKLSLLHAFLLLALSNITHYHFFISHRFIATFFFASRIQPEFQMGVVGSSLIFSCESLVNLSLYRDPCLTLFFFIGMFVSTCRSDSWKYASCMYAV